MCEHERDVSHWNYRVCFVDGKFEIRDVYYDSNGEVQTWGHVSSHPHGDSLGELRKDTVAFISALFKPALYLHQLKEE